MPKNEIELLEQLAQGKEFNVKYRAHTGVLKMINGHTILDIDGLHLKALNGSLVSFERLEFLR